MTPYELNRLLKQAIVKFYQHDIALIERRGMEQACVFRIGLYLDELMKQDNRFSNLHLDCEYNKNGNGRKITESFPKGARPDLIIHRRNDYDNNLIVEFKGWWNKENDKDTLKLKDFTGWRDGYIYKLGVFVHLGRTLETTVCKYYRMGNEVEENDL